MRTITAEPVDAKLAGCGYLRTPAGRVRYIWSLDLLIRAVRDQGGMLYWAALPQWAYCYCWSRVVLLDPGLIELEPWEVRRVVAEEVAHLAVGRSEARARDWSRRRFGALIDPPE